MWCASENLLSKNEKGTKKKNDKTLFIAAVIVFALAVGLFVGSYARYYTSVSIASQDITTAAWDFKVNGQTGNITLNLLDTSSCEVYNLVEVGNVKKIQPGSFGTCDITLAATNSDVDVLWRSTANIFFTNWLNYYVYQVTPYVFKK